MPGDSHVEEQVFGGEHHSGRIARPLSVDLFFNDQPRIQTALCDAYDERSLANALHAFRWPQFDFICDDAVHDPLPQRPRGRTPAPACRRREPPRCRCPPARGAAPCRCRRTRC